MMQYYDTSFQPTSTERQLTWVGHAQGRYQIKGEQSQHGSKLRGVCSLHVYCLMQYLMAALNSKYTDKYKITNYNK